MKIKFFANYDSSENLLKRFKNNYPINDNKLSFTTGDDYDAAVVFNRTYENVKEDCTLITIVQEPSWSSIHNNNEFLTDSDYLLIHDGELFEKTLKIKLGGEVINTPSRMWYHDHVPYSFFDGTDKIKKKKKLSMVVSSIYMSVGIYKQRIELLNKILASDLEIDIFGRGLQTEDKRYKGEIQDKFSALIPYEYSICIENSHEKNYLTEKFIDATVCHTIPIYCGAPNVGEIYNPGGYTNLDLNSSRIIEDIKEITNTKFDKNVLLKNKEIYFSTYNLYENLKEILL